MREARRRGFLKHLQQKPTMMFGNIGNAESIAAIIAVGSGFVGWLTWMSFILATIKTRLEMQMQEHAARLDRGETRMDRHEERIEDHEVRLTKLER